MSLLAVPAGPSRAASGQTGMDAAPPGYTVVQSPVVSLRGQQHQQLQQQQLQQQQPRPAMGMMREATGPFREDSGLTLKAAPVTTQTLHRQDSLLSSKGLNGLFREDSQATIKTAATLHCSPRPNACELAQQPQQQPRQQQQPLSTPQPPQVWRTVNTVRTVQQQVQQPQVQVQAPQVQAPQVQSAPQPLRICVSNCTSGCVVCLPPNRSVLDASRPNSVTSRVSRIVTSSQVVTHAASMPQSPLGEASRTRRRSLFHAHDGSLTVPNPTVWEGGAPPLVGSLSSVSTDLSSWRDRDAGSSYSFQASDSDKFDARGLNCMQGVAEEPEQYLDREDLQWDVDGPWRQVQPSATPSAEDGFPTTGRPLVLKIMCSYTESSHPVTLASFEGYKITSDWELSHLLRVTEMMTGVMRSSQKLYHAGRELYPGVPIKGIIGVKEENMPDRFTVHVIVNEERFPQRFGPLNIAEVPLGPRDIVMPKSTRGGFHWMMKTEVVERFGVRSPSDKQVTAQCSPTHKIPFSKQDRAEASIPPEAVEFAFSNPVANWEQVEQDPHLLEDWGLCAMDSSVVKDFLVMGGFIFLDKEQEIVKVTALRLANDMEGGLRFRKRQKWQACWTKALIGDGCFHRVPHGQLKHAGAQFFCWLRPGEIFTDDDGRPFDRQPDVPHGGFAFLFHEMGANSAQELVVDCYFAIDGIDKQVPSPSKAAFDSDDGEDCPTSLVGHTSAQLNHHKLCALDG